MDAVQPHSGPRGAQLLAWIGVSAIAHLAALSLGGGIAPVSAPYLAPMQADIRHVTPDSPPPLAIPGPEPLMEKPAPIMEPPPANIARKAAIDKNAPAAAIELPLPFDGYFGPEAVDVRAEPANDALLTYPLLEYMQKIGGTVRVVALINEHGGIDKVTVIDAGPQKLFEKAALQAVNKLLFTPALKNGLPVKSRKTIEVVFDPYEPINTP